MKETLRRVKTVTLSLNEISIRVSWEKGGGRRYSALPPPLSTAGLWIDI
jgi:hypothetical protein